MDSSGGTHEVEELDGFGSLKHNQLCRNQSHLQTAINRNSYDYTYDSIDFEDISLFCISFAVPFSEKLIDGINQSETRRRALIFFCLVYLNTNARVSLKIFFFPRSWPKIFSDSQIHDPFPVNWRKKERTKKMGTSFWI